ncbi:sigma-54 interaction domain-containing protein [Dethiosulfatibacter aminovorans]|uniref:sigma-54 interaction domain-containing protein n=1 Tax=Dethiosulfatibacter aminovorans TaxID=332095 RepID=UPI00158714F7|nr:sigma 54-interacting transcriptional regulator [Dethiosulfatibacter aminovorans]
MEIKEKNKLDFEEIANYLHDAIFVSAGDGEVLFVNSAYTRMTGIAAEEVVGRNISDLEGSLFTNSVTLKVIKNKKAMNSIGKSLKTGNEMLVSGIPIFNEDGTIKYVVVNDRQIEELEGIKEELESAREKLAVAKKDTYKKKLEIDHLKKALASKNTMIGVSSHIESIKNEIEHIADTDVNILIIGETGVGKEVIANEVYTKSSRRDKPYIKINCAAIPDNLMESELFGHEKGSFTGAEKKKIGLLELADGGTVLLDEIGELPLNLQSKLLRVIQQKEIMRIGKNDPIKVDIRIIAATNRDLKARAEEGKFRLDLYYRLNVLPINVKPLRDRKEDIPELGDFFIDRFNKKYGKSKHFNEDAKRLLLVYDWPGNVRELENIIERLVVITMNDEIGEGDIRKVLLIGDDEKNFGSCNIKDEVEKLEIEILKRAMREHGSTRDMARVLGINQSNVVRKMRKYNLK